MNAEHLAKEADRLKNDDTLNNALRDMRNAALNALAIADADDTTEILRLQQRVAAIDEFHTILERHILAIESVQDDKSPYV